MKAALEAAMAEARAAILASPDPDAAARRLLRHARREMAFVASPAALTQDEILTARSGGFGLQRYANARRVFVTDQSNAMQPTTERTV